MLTMLPRARGRWEEDAPFSDVVRIAEAADRLGYAFMTCSEHVGIPEAVAEVRGGRYWDPLATFGFLAARTERIRFLTYVLVLGYHHPLEIAKRYGTLDQVCGGRLTLGVGVGSLREEFDLVGAAFTERGARGDDALRALRASLGRRMPAYEGTHHSYSGFIVDPCALQQDMPIWIGGRTYRSLRRAVELADGWIPFGLTIDEMGAMVARASQTAGWDARDRPPRIVLPTVQPLDPIGDPEGTRTALAAFEAAGADALTVGFRHSSCSHHIEQMEALITL